MTDERAHARTTTRRERTRRGKRGWGPGSAETAALLSLAYDNGEKFWINTNPPPLDFIRALSRKAGDMSMLRFFTNHVLSEPDWLVVKALQEHPEHVPALIQELDIVRQVAVVHAMFAIAADRARNPEFARDEYLRNIQIGAALSLKVAETWEAVEEARELWNALGISMTREHVAELSGIAKQEIEAREERALADLVERMNA